MPLSQLMSANVPAQAPVSQKVAPQAAPQRNLSLQVQDLQEELVQRVPAFKYTPGKFDDATNKALIYFVRDTKPANKENPVWQTLRKYYESAENPIISADSRETYQNLNQILAIFRSGGEPQEKEVTQKVFAEIPIKFRDLPVVNFPLLYAAQSKEQLDQVIRQFILDPWFTQHGQSTEQHDPSEVKVMIEEVMRLVLAAIEARPEYQNQQQQFVGLHLLLAKRFNEVLNAYQSKLDTKQSADNIYERLSKDFFMYYGNPNLKSNPALQQATEEIVYFLQRQMAVDQNGMIVRPQRYDDAKIPIEGVLRRYFGDPSKWKIPAQQTKQPGLTPPVPDIIP